MLPPHQTNIQHMLYKHTVLLHIHSEDAVASYCRIANAVMRPWQEKNQSRKALMRP
jgi:hypothetical protein